MKFKTFICAISSSQINKPSSRKINNLKKFYRLRGLSGYCVSKVYIFSSTCATANKTKIQLKFFKRLSLISIFTSNFAEFYNVKIIKNYI